MQFDPYPDPEGSFRAAVIGTAIAVVLLFGIFAVSGELTWKVPIYVLVPSAIVLVGFYYAQRWGHPFMRRLINRLDGPEAVDFSKRPKQEGPKQEVEVVPTAEGRYWFQNVRVQFVEAFVTPLVACAILSVFLGTPLLIMGLGLVLGLGSVLIVAAMWITQRTAMEERGFWW